MLASTTPPAPRVCNDMLRHVCGVKCMRRVPLTTLLPTELAFRDQIRALDWVTGHDCHVITALDREVAKGAVRRWVAGALASELHERENLTRFGDDTILLVSLLWFALRTPTPCECVHVLLAWGVCPHVVLVAQSVADTSQVGLGTPAVTAPEVGMFMSHLLPSGSPPWHMYSCRVANGGGHWDVQVVNVQTFDRPPLYKPPSGAVAQWWRWHARASRRHWICQTISHNPFACSTATSVTATCAV
jgi:hypothetical protein